MTKKVWFLSLDIKADREDRFMIALATDHS